MRIGTVDQLWRFPVKSMLGERVDAAEVTAGGVLGDRAYALLDVTDGKVVSAKNPRKWAQVLELRAAFVDEPTTDDPTPPVTVTFPDGTTVRSDEPGGRTDATLTAFLGRPVHLTHEAPATPTMEETWPDVEGLAPESFIASTRVDTGDPTETVSDITMAMAAPKGTFFDLAELHLMTTSTLDELRRRGPGDFDVRRYRPNVVVATDEAGFVENAWSGRRLALGEGGAGATISFPTMRCIMTTLPQPAFGLTRDPSLLRTIAEHNRLTIGGGQWACAGVYAGVAGTGRIAVGDTVTLD